MYSFGNMKNYNQSNLPITWIPIFLVVKTLKIYLLSKFQFYSSVINYSHHAVL